MQRGFRYAFSRVSGATKVGPLSDLQIVCGAPNVQAGQKVAVGLAPAMAPKTQHDPEGKPFTLSKVKVRGEGAGLLL